MRLFIAILFSDEIKDKLCDAIDTLKQTAVRGNFTRRENLHLTLVFIGETNREDEIEKAIDAVNAQPFTLSIGGLGKFRRNGGDIYWAGVKPSNELQSVYRQLYTALTAAGFKLENREYKPHLTLGREVTLPGGFDKNSLNAAVEEMSMSVSAIHLMKSERINGKLVYTSLYQKDTGISAAAND